MRRAPEPVRPWVVAMIVVYLVGMAGVLLHAERVAEAMTCQDRVCAFERAR